MKRVLTTFIAPGGNLVYLQELDDHTVELLSEGQVIARFTQTGITIENILKEIETHDRGN